VCNTIADCNYCTNHCLLSNYRATELILVVRKVQILIMKRAAGVTGCGCTLTVVVLLTGLLLAACISTGEGTAADSRSHDKSQDTSEESNDAVLKSISPLESAIMPVGFYAYVGLRMQCRI